MSIQKPSHPNVKGIRKSSARKFLGLPLLDIAIGPDFEKGELRGHAKGILAIGDIAQGGIAIGGVSVGVLALGGCAVGIFAVGGCALGALALGGLAVGGIALGGAAIGAVAVGGGAIGYYAFGGGALGKHIVSATERSPEAVAFFQRWLPFLPLR